MPNRIIHRRSALADRAPTTSSLALGEIAINTFDGKAYIKKNVGGATERIVDLSPMSGRNRIINGCCRIAQRADLPITGNAGPGLYGGCDRIYGFTSGFTTVSGVLGQRASGIGTFGMSQAVLGLTTTGSGSVTFGQRLERDNVMDLNGKIVTLSAVALQNTGAAQNLALRLGRPKDLHSFSNLISISSSPAFSIPSGVPTFVSAMFNPTVSNGIFVEAVFSGLGALSARDFHVSDFQLEAGSVATPLETRPLGVEMALCQRFFEAGQCWATSTAASASLLQRTPLFFGVTKRDTPVLALSVASGKLTNPSAVALARNGASIEFASAAAGLDGVFNFTASAEL